MVTTIGICEDDQAVRAVLTDALKMSGYDVAIARNGTEAVQNFGRAGSVDVLIVDIGLPDADGRDVCQALRAQGQHAPVLFLTALDGVHHRVAGFHAGGDDYLAKPFALAEVLARIGALLKRTRPDPEITTGLRLDPGRFSLRWQNTEVRLTPTLFLAVIVAVVGYFTVLERGAPVATSTDVVRAA